VVWSTYFPIKQWHTY